jgi:hypothetical protein
MTRWMKIAVLGLVCGTAAAIAPLVKCPVDGLIMGWTGMSRAESGKILREHKCPNGHVSWIVQ